MLLYLAQCFSRALCSLGEPELVLTFKETNGANSKRKVEADVEPVEPVLKIERSSHSDSYESTYSLESRNFIAGGISFDKVRLAIDTDRLDLLGRSPSQHKTYLDFLASVKREFASISDFVLANRIKMRTEIDASNKIYVPRPFDLNYSGKTFLLLNDFPYNFSEDVFHFCLWKINDKVSPSDIDKAIDKLKSMQRGSSFEFLSFINPPHLKSIPDIDHAHIIVRDPEQYLKFEFESSTISII